jgi:hypothetical protein
MLGFKSRQQLEDEVRQLLNDNGIRDEPFVGCIVAMVMPSIGYYFLAGAFAGFLVKSKMLAITDKHMVTIDMGMTSNFQSFSAYLFSELTLLKSSRNILGTFKLTIKFPDKSKTEFNIPGARGGKEIAEKLISLLPKTADRRG